MKRYVQIADDGAGSLRPAWRSADTLHLVYVGYGLHEHGFFGPFRKYGLERGDDTAP